MQARCDVINERLVEGWLNRNRFEQATIKRYHGTDKKQLWLDVPNPHLDDRENKVDTRITVSLTDPGSEALPASPSSPTSSTPSNRQSGSSPITPRPTTPEDDFV